MFKLFKNFNRIEQKLLSLYDLRLLILKEMNRNHPIFFQMQVHPEPQHNQIAEIKGKEPKQESEQCLCRH